MRIDLFELERNQSIWENTVKYNLTESGLHPFTLREILSGDEIEALLDLPLGYGHTEGEPALRQAIASLHPGAGPENVLVTTGSSEANMLTVMSTLEAGDEAIIITPTFMQAPGLAKALGAQAHLCPLRLDRDRWVLDIDDVRRKITGKTRLISLCNPNNPTGSILAEAERTALVALCAEHDLHLHSDEIYRGTELGGDEIVTLHGAAPRTIVTGGTAKGMALAGLRIGWMVAPQAVIEKAMRHQDYTTIGSNIPGQRVALHALQPQRRAKILARNREVLAGNLGQMRQWIEGRSDLFSWVPPQAGAMAFLRYSLPDSSQDLCRKLRERKSVFVVAGSWFGMENHLRFGIGGEAEALHEALALIDDFLAEEYGVSKRALA